VSTVRAVAPTLAASGVSGLLDVFRRIHEGVEVRLWTPGPEGWTCVYPRGVTGGAGPGPGARRLPGGDGVFELEVEGGGVTEREIEFLAEALAQVLSYETEARLAAEELAERYEEINLLYSISETLGSVLSVEEAGRRILAEVADVLAARRASLWVYEPEDGYLHLAAAVGEEGLTGPISPDDPESVTAQVFRERRARNIERAVARPRGPRLEPPPRRRGEPFLSVPIPYTPPEGPSRTVGVINLVGRWTSEAFDAGDARLLAAIASQIGAALERQRLVRESLRRERLERELELAHDLQLKLLPDISKLATPAEIAARCVPADSVGGDFYHLFPLAGDRLGVLIGDVSGHGFPASLIMALTISAVAIYALEARPPGEVVARVHAAIIDELETTEMYVSLFYGVLDARGGRIVYANAGHPQAFRICPDGSAQRLGATSPALGTVTLPEYGEAASEWGSGRDLLCLFTDGLSDAFAGGGRAGEGALLAEVARLRDRPPAEILEHIFDLTGNAETAVPPDDRTAVLVRI
jgi:sigma-B regulation protein RsbU (phosphoserine phosphatase)